ncbi:hypothetical protein [Bradyrhizobium liaoningense]|uniref:hypothetical protein n=1 Tax=Bradyrhizobium liaoningense TaxID=43992 RepID=UPI001BA92730|nr:hypothetical protein [Bradyrhizobium liaoningense]MBR0823754.1 hypothetical protein [Bradyrhizobium liaoningense]
MRTLVLVSLGLLTLGQTTPGRAETLRWKCDYTLIASPKGLAAEAFSLEFALDTATKKAVIIGNAGMSDVAAVGGNQGITFQEKLASGAIQTTTIANDGSSVHSRHTIIGRAVVPSQYYGKCQ